MARRPKEPGKRSTSPAAGSRPAAPSQPSQPEPTGGQPPPAQLLNQIKEQLARLEGELVSTPPAEQAIQRELEQARATMQAQARRIQELEDKLATGAKTERELSTQVASLVREKDQTAAALAEARRQLDAQRQKRGSGKGGAPAAAGKSTAKDSAPAEHKPRPEAWWRTVTPRQQLMAGGAAVVLLLCGLMTLWAMPSGSLIYRAKVVVSVPEGDGETLQQLAAHLPTPGAAGVIPGFDRRNDAEAGTLSFWLDNEESPEAAEHQIATLRDAMLKQWKLKQPEATEPPSSAERAALEKRLRGLDERLTATATRPAADADRTTALLNQWKQVISQRQQLQDGLARVKQAVAASSPTEENLPDLSAQLHAAEQADLKFLADVDALKGRQAQLAAALVILLRNAGGAFSAFDQAAASGDAYLEEQLKAGHGDGADKLLGQIRDIVRDWRQAGQDLAKVWNEEQTALTDRPESDPLASVERLGKYAKAFVDASAGGMSRYQQALQALGQTGDQPTKSLVLRNNVSKNLQSVVDLREAVEGAGKFALIHNNAELAALAQAVSGLKSLVETRRSQIAAAVRQKMLSEFQARHQQKLAEAQKEAADFEQKIAAADGQLQKMAVEAMTLLNASHEQQAALLKRTELLRERAEVEARLAEVRAREAHEAKLLALPPAVRVLPVEVTPLPSASTRGLGSALLLGMLPLGIALLATGGYYGVRSWLRSRETIEQYTRQLQAAARGK